MDFKEFDDNFPYRLFYEKYIPDGKIHGQEIRGCCPLHEDKNPSFSANITHGAWRCYAGCGTGSLITFYAKLKNVDTSESFKMLCEEYGFKHLITPEDNSKKIPKEVWNQMPVLNDGWLKALQDVRGWSPEVMKALDLRIQTIYQSKETGEIKPVKGEPTRVAIPVYNSKKELINAKLYCPRPKDGESKNMPWGSGYKTSVFWPQPGSAVPDEGVIYLCEGEPDTMCALSHGLNACTPLSKQIEWPANKLKRFKDRDVVIVPDADQPGMKYAVNMGEAIRGVARSVMLLSWPDFMGRDKFTQLWPEKHGQDLTDFFMKHKKTVEDFHAMFLDPLPEKPGASVADDGEFQTVTREGNAYYAWRFPPKGEPKKVRISNFVMDFERVYRGSDGVVCRGVCLTNMAGRRVGPVDCDARQLTIKTGFASWALGYGDYSWLGLQGDLEKVVEMELKTQQPREITRFDHAGFIKREQLWLFPTFAIRNGEGEVFLADKDGVVWIDGCGYQSEPLVDKPDVAEEMKPKVRCDLSDEKIDQVRKELLRAIIQNVNNYGVYLVLGFVPMCIYMPEITSEFGSSSLFLLGQHQAGKNTVGRLIFDHFGIGKDAMLSISSMTAPGLNNIFGYYSCLPGWVDEFRPHEQSSKQFEGALRAMWDQTGGKKGTLGFEVAVKPIRAPLLLSGESSTDDSALASRCAQVYLSEKDRNDDIYPQIMELRPYLSGIVYKFLKEKTPSKAKLLNQNIFKTVQALKAAGVQSREATVYAVLFAAFHTIYNPDDVNGDANETKAWLVKHTTQAQKMKLQNSPVFEFLEDIISLLQNGKIGPNHIQHTYTNDEILLWFPAIFSEWQKEMGQRRVTSWSKKTIMAYMSEQEWFVREGHVRINGIQRRGITLNGKLMPGHIFDGLIKRSSSY